MMTLALRAIGLKGLALELARFGVILGLFGGAYLWLAAHHYNRGYAARSAEIAEQTRKINAEVVSVGEADARVRAAAETARQEAIRAAWEAFRAEPAASPPPASSPAPGCPEPRPRGVVCRGVPASALNQLNRIK